jgi:hypothetical protein
MRDLHWTLGTAAGLLLGCSIPSTLGLPCVMNPHCDPNQHCGADMLCVEGPPPMMDGGLPTDGPPPSTGVGPGPGSDGMTSNASDGDTTGLDPTTSATTESSTGAACGRAIGTCDAVDVLFVVDNSGSMDDDTAQLIPAFGNVKDLVGILADGPCSYHVGVTTTEAELDFQPVECQLRGALSQAGAICPDPWPGEPDHPPWISETDDLNTLGCLLTVGTNEDTDEKQLQTLLESLGPELQGPGGCNEGFLREGVPLLVFLVTDEDDDDDSADPAEAFFRKGSEGGPSDWWNDLTAIRDPSALGLLLLASTDADSCPWVPSTGNSDGTGAEYAERLLTFVQHFTATGYADHFRAVDLCQPAEDIVAQFQQVTELLINVCDDTAG